ncbi:GNAT family N-acetyltransferase [Vibrio sagamiensis]|uniref:N-acetyltransferase GCN5 n=1 Tax=Vibrio sagamiensis NBRC 104589 TaxID=1219064 RepID=A0A511QCD0_9VIBR|nr:GNAT family N-acetyltransferase [Vibrio sagamiensis]PNQ58976.1 N-acetyltransferase [Vibrio agarivorans]GEM74950.1 N-acetyltransferase GCN5 [Vibrio sagamiensis NBRC 104589]
MSITIRKAELTDIKAISELLTHLTKKYVCPTCEPSVHQVLLQSMSEESVHSYLTGNYFYMVAVSPKNNVVGVAGIRGYQHLFHLFIDDKYQGKGLSRTLWQAVKEVSLQNGNSGFFTTNSALNAENVYLKFGFKRVAGIRNREGMIDIPMSLEINN